MILSSVLVTLLLLRNNLIPLYQFLNFIQSLSNHPKSDTIFLGIPACTISLFTAGAVDISVSVCLSLFEASSMILKDPNLSDNTSISFVLLELVLFHLHSFLLQVFHSLIGNSA